MRTALALFTIVPVRDAAALTRERAVVALRWFPLVGAGLGAVAALPLAAVRAWAPHATLLGAVLAVALLALCSRGLHLDGLADTADGLASRAPAERALQIMRRSDIGPFGVLGIVLTVLIDIAALAALDGSSWRPVAALAVAAATGRLAVLHAAHPRVPSARTSGFGAYVAGSVATPVAALETVVVLGGAAGLAAAVHTSVLGWLVASASALVAVAGVRWHTTRRLGGVTGDVFGALVEIGTALTLTGLAFC
ncbi:MAG TPA: adenosylcobinamide-GDP ribazoletransferase [Jatrophihabitantaceae bacterium]|jgi:adenosylcobinamide-GDP ribazoletransferase